MSNWVKILLSIAAEADNYNTSPDSSCSVSGYSESAGRLVLPLWQQLGSAKDSSKGRCVPLYCDGVHIGLIKPSTLTDLLQHGNTFQAERTDEGVVVGVTISEKLRSVEDRTVAVNEVFKGLLSLEDRYPCLRGWRNEPPSPPHPHALLRVHAPDDSHQCGISRRVRCDKGTGDSMVTRTVFELFSGALRPKVDILRFSNPKNYAVAESFGKTTLLQCERAGSRLLGVKQYGVHLSGYIKTANGDYKLWIARRSPMKATYPCLLDNMVAGGVEAGSSVLQTLIKECEEEASIGPELAGQARATGTISYCHETSEGIERETEFIYELELPSDFIPTPQDNEVSDFYLWDIDQVTNEIAKRNFKPNCVLVILQFLLQHGLITPEEEPEYERLACCCHVQLT